MSRMGCVLLAIPPKTGFVASRCNDKETLNALPPVVGLGAPVTVLGAVWTKEPYLRLKPQL